MPDKEIKAATDAAGGALGSVKRGLSKQIGPLPLWGWGVTAGVGGVVVYYVFFRSAGGTVSGLSTTPGGTQSGGGGLAGGGGGTTPGPSDTTPPAPFAPITIPGVGVITGPGQTFTPTPTPSAPATPSTPADTLTNPQWIAKAIPAVISQLGLSAAQVQFYLSEYVAGGRPVGSPGAASTFQRVVDAAVQAVGAVPTPPTANPNANFFSNNLTWLQNAEAFLGTSDTGVMQEIRALFAGQTTTISQAAADALANAEGVIGVAPSPVTFTIRQPAAPAQPSQPSNPVSPTQPLPSPPISFDLTTVQALVDDAASVFKNIGGRINEPANYIPIFKRHLPGLDDQQIQAIQDELHFLYSQNPTPSTSLVRDLINRTIASGERHAVPGGSPTTGGGGQVNPGEIKYTGPSSALPGIGPPKLVTNTT